MLGRRDVGRRVVVRRFVGVRDDRPVYSDVLGQLVAVTDADVTVVTRTGTQRVPVTEIMRAKTVPDRRRLSATEALELAAAAGWPAADQGRLGDWLLRATGGWTRRGNSCLPIGEPDRPLAEAIDAVAAWYAERDLDAAIVVPLPLRTGLDDELARRGWYAESLTMVRTASLETVLAAAPERPDLPPVRLDRTPSPEWLAVAAARKKSLPDAALAVLTGPPDVRFASVHDDTGTLLATARGVVADEGRRWLGVSLVEVSPAAQRQGLARHVMRALAQWAAGLGARDCYLQVLETNTVAIALYDRLGFTTHHRYGSRVWQRAGG